jgi:hypothetical protein
MLHADGNTDTRTDGQTGMKKLIVVFLNFANVPQKCYVMPTPCIHVFEVCFGTEKKCVYCAVRTEYLYITQVNLSS